MGQGSALHFWLFPDVTSQGVLRGGLEEVAEAWSTHIGPLLNETNWRIESAGAKSTNEDPPSGEPSGEVYDQLFREALEWFETEIDDEGDDGHE